MVAAAHARLPIGAALFVLPPFEFGIWSGVGFASLLAFFAFTGFEDLTNMVEEAQAPERNVPIAMAITLVVVTVIYVVIAAIAVTAIPTERLAASEAPLSLVFRDLAGISPVTISAIGIVATLNTIIAQMTMAIRVVYGMARQGDLPRGLGHVSQSTATPLAATVFIVVLALLLALFATFERLAEITSLATLLVFALVNLALLKIRLGRAKPHRSSITVPLFVPLLGFVTCVAMIMSSLL